TMGTAADIVDEWWTTLERGDLDALAKLVAPDAEITMPGGLRMQGPAELIQVLSAYLAGFPELRHAIVYAEATEEAIAVELRITMVHSGTFVTPAGELPPTGRQVILEACDVVRLSSAGAITSWHTYFDQASLMAQLA